MALNPAYTGETLKSGSGILASADYSGTTNVAGLYGPTGVGGYNSGMLQAVTINSSGQAVIVSAVGQGSVKVLGNKPQEGDPCLLYDVGEVKVVAGAAVAIGQIVMTDADGRFVPWVADDGNVPVGECRVAAAAAGDYFTIFMFPNFLGENEGAPVNTDNITAHAGGGQANAVLLSNGWNHVTVVATAADSVQLPQSAPGSMVLVANSGAETLYVYPVNGGTDVIIGGTSTGTDTEAAEVPTSAPVAMFVCITAGKWIASLMTAPAIS